MPDSVMKKVKSWGRRDKQSGLLSFCNRNNEPFDWSDEQDVLIEDNTPKPEPTTSPDVPAETPGVSLEWSVQAIVTQPPLSDQQRMAAVLDNAAIAGKFEEFRYMGRRAGNK
jgi:hypothetical protein